VQICVEGPSGVTLKKWNVDSSMASSNRRLIGIRSGCYSVGMHFQFHDANGEVSPAKSIS